MSQNGHALRETIFISKATPEDDEFALWLAPRLEAAGYMVFADVLSLQGGDRWRKVVTNTLQNNATKMLLCCRDSSLAKNGVQEEIGIAEDVAKELQDPRFIIPLRLERHKKIFGIGELQRIDFLGSWARGLKDLLDTLENQNVPCNKEEIEINPNWESYKKRLANKIEYSPETLTSNWLRISNIPDKIYYYQPSGAVNHSLMELKCNDAPVPAIVYLRGFFTFAIQSEIQTYFSDAGKFVLHSKHDISDFLAKGSCSPNIRPNEAKKLVTSIFRKSWENMCRSKGLYEYGYSKQLGFHITKEHVALSKRVPWGEKEFRRSSALRGVAKGRVWQYGVTATPQLWPFPHFRLKARVLFSELASSEAGPVIDDTSKQHRLRRSICSGWRNKAWHGRMMAYIKLLSNGIQHIDLALSDTCHLTLEATPIQVESPVTTYSPNNMLEDAEESDTSTLGNFGIEDDE